MLTLHRPLFYSTRHTCTKPLRRSRSGRRQVREAAKNRRRTRPAEENEVDNANAKKKKAAAAAAEVEVEEDDDDEVEELDLDVIEAVAARPVRGGGGGDGNNEVGGAGSTTRRRQKLSKKAARRAARRAQLAAEEGYQGNGVWEKDGFSVVVAGDVDEQRPIGTGPAMDFLAGKLMGNRHRRSKEMLLDPKKRRGGK